MLGGEERARYSVSFYLAMLVSLVFFISMQLMLWELPLYVSGSYPGAAAVGLIIGVMALPAVLLRPLAGEWADRHGRKPLILWGAFCFTLAPVLYALAPPASLLVLGRLIHGLGICLFTTGYGSLIPDLAMPGRRGEAIGLASIALPVSIIVAPRLGSLLREVYGFQALSTAALARIEGVWPLVLLSLAFGLCFGAVRISLDALFVDSVPLRGRGSAVSAEYAVYDLGIGLGQWLFGGVAAIAGYAGMFGLLGGLVLVAAVVFVSLVRRAPHVA